jgi:hypothetical protein
MNVRHVPFVERNGIDLMLGCGLWRIWSTTRIRGWSKRQMAQQTHGQLAVGDGSLERADEEEEKELAKRAAWDERL